jgi:ESF2/ABP1 family protein
MELSQSRQEQNDYLRQVELKRVLDKRAERRSKRVEMDTERKPETFTMKKSNQDVAMHSAEMSGSLAKKSKRKTARNVLFEQEISVQTEQLESVLSSIF